MKKRMLSLLCVLALCLGLLPVTALAAGEDAPESLFVGGQVFRDNTSYWTTNSETGKLTEYKDGGDAWNVQYDPETATLTLNGATIDGGEYSTTYYGAGIYARCKSGQPVSLTIKLIGENTITGSYGIYVDAQQGERVGANASLKITGDGSLKVSSSAYGIVVKSGTGNAALTIEEASVKVEISDDYAGYGGVIVQASNRTTDSPTLSLAVNGGSLTASGGENSDGIQFNVVNPNATNATTSLTVSGNAIVDARTGGIRATRGSTDLPTPTPTGGNSSGIVFDDTEGTVYGNVTLDEPLTVGESETLTIPEGSTLNTNGKLTNDGTINVESGGNLEGEPTSGSGTVVKAPTITTPPTNQSVTVGQTASFTVEANGDSLSYQWQQSADNGTNWNNISGATSNSYTTDAATLEMNNYQYQCVVSNSAGSVTSNAATLTVTQPVTGVTLDQTELSLYTGESKPLTAKVEPNDATNKNVTWSSNKTEVATVENGEVTAKAAGTATITVTTEDGEKTATCTVTVTDKTYKISSDPTALDFGSVYTGYAQPAAKTVTITNTGNQPLTLNLPASTSSFEVGALTDTELAVGEKATFTVQPKAGLAVDTYNETITVTGPEGANLSIPVTFRVRQYISPPTKTPSQQAMDKIEAAKDGDTVEITLSTGNTKLDKEVFEELAGQDITLVVKLSGGVSWTVNGQDIPKNATLTDLDMGVSMNTSTIPVNLINMVTGKKGTVQMTLAHDGEFGFTMTLTAPVGTENKGLWANLYHYDTTRKQMLFETAAQVDTSGNVALKFSHASEYAIVLDTKSHELPFDDVNVGDWFQAAVEYVYRNGIMTGTSATTFEPGTTLSRAMVAQILYNLEGQPTVTEATTFTDSGTHWAAKAIAWAQKTGVVSGYEDNTFRPNKAVTREELAQMLYNYAKYKDYDLTASGDLTAFPDGEEVSSWAETAMAWANGNELINGHDDGTLEPSGDSTRAQAASILMNFDVNLAN